MKTFLLMLCLVASALTAEELHITIYNKAGLSDATLDSAIHVVRAIFRQAKIHLYFRPGDLTSEEARNVVYIQGTMSPGDHQRLACEARREIALDLTSPSSSGGGFPLGVAYPLAATGLNVRIFTNRVSDTATRNARAFTTVLANVIAHEIGHVLTRSASHDRYGIMAADWSHNEFEQMARSRYLFFTKQHVRQMRSTLSGEGCATAPVSAAILNPR